MGAISYMFYGIEVGGIGVGGEPYILLPHFQDINYTFFGLYRIISIDSKQPTIKSEL